VLCIVEPQGVRLSADRDVKDLQGISLIGRYRPEEDDPQGWLTSCALDMDLANGFAPTACHAGEKHVWKDC